MYMYSAVSITISYLFSWPHDSTPKPQSHSFWGKILKWNITFSCFSFARNLSWQIPIHFHIRKLCYWGHPLILPTTTSWNSNLCDPLSSWPIYVANETSYVHLSVVNFLWSDSSFSFLLKCLHSRLILKNSSLEG